MNTVGRIAPRTALLFLFLLAAAIFVFPITNPSSSVFYISSFFLIASLWLASSHKGMGNALDYLLLSPKRKDLFLLLQWGVAAFLALCAMTFALNVIFYFVGLDDGALVKQKISVLPLPVLILAFTFAPLAEEAFFRGLLFRKISEMRFGAGKRKKGSKEKSSGWVAGALISSIVFSSTHLLYGSVAEVLAVFVLGLALCAVTHKTKSLVPAVVAHMLFNFLSILMMVLV